ncbi:MAG: 2TM domain-containing protein [Solirubrobacteraceae bacterium]|nr:2TM domain-containing protein [Solirubrobacteraceae bacterium]
MHDDPFARAVERAKATERADAEARRQNIKREVGGYVSRGARTALRIHASVFVAVNLLLVIIWATATPGYPWFHYPFFGWGIGLVAHYAATSDFTGGGRRRGASSRGSVAQQPAPAPVSPAPAPAPAPVATAPSTGGSTSDELSRLSELHRSGVLTDKEFKAAKAKLLG